MLISDWSSGECSSDLWRANGTVPPNYSEWKAMLAQLRDIRPGGPQDRVTPADRAILASELLNPGPAMRVEVELVFRRGGLATALPGRQQFAAARGPGTSRSRTGAAGYQACVPDLHPAPLSAVMPQYPAGLSLSAEI